MPTSAAGSAVYRVGGTPALREPLQSLSGSAHISKFHPTDPPSLLPTPTWVGLGAKWLRPDHTHCGRCVLACAGAPGTTAGDVQLPALPCRAWEMEGLEGL